eukprot:2660768-Prymnesium_polylepis.1
MFDQIGGFLSRTTSLKKPTRDRASTVGASPSSGDAPPVTKEASPMVFSMPDCGAAELSASTPTQGGPVMIGGFEPPPEDMELAGGRRRSWTESTIGLVRSGKTLVPTMKTQRSGKSGSPA